ncbi:MAG: hypothetical protein D6705_03330 [Deltaproteobacteria bacterium]|nr:MAG: hypothetical protein D6705_03330 [Deltaproteobacteria bacterium]
MTHTSLAALVRARFSAPFWSPEFVSEVLEACWAPCGDRTRGWSVGCVLGTETLVQTRPMIRSKDGRFLEDFLRTPAPCTIASYACDRDATQPPAPLVHRVGRWIGAAVCDGPVDVEAIVADLPDFLRRERRTREPDEAIFLAFLGALYGEGGLRGAYATEAELAGALGRVRKAVGEAHDLLVHDGRSVGIVNGRGRLSVFRAPPEPGRRTQEDRPVQAALFTTCDLPFEQAARSGAERLSPGAFIVRPARPMSLERVD